MNSSFRKLIKFKKIVTIVVICTLGLSFYRYKTSVVSLYSEVNYEDDSRYIEMNDSVVVMPAVLQYKIHSHYMFGIRLPQVSYFCSDHYDSRLKNQKSYFVLNLKTQELKEFTKQLTFERYISSLGIGTVTLNYGKFEEVWSTYSYKYSLFPLSDDCIQL